jgi:hypothetical protein
MFASEYVSLFRPIGAKAVPGRLESELEVSEEYVSWAGTAPGWAQKVKKYDKKRVRKSKTRS